MSQDSNIKKEFKDLLDLSLNNKQAQKRAKKKKSYDKYREFLKSKYNDEDELRT